MDMFNTLIKDLNKITGFRFYFIALLIFFAGITYLVKDSLQTYIKTHVGIEFRECRNVGGLEQAFNNILKEDSVIARYGVYLYQPKDNAFYKKMILTNSAIAKGSSTLQGIYLKDQPIINLKLLQNNYYFIDKDEALKHPELQYIINIDPAPSLFYSLRVNNQLIGEIGIRFKRAPTAAELDKVLRDLGPLLYLYIL